MTRNESLRAGLSAAMVFAVLLLTIWLFHLADNTLVPADQIANDYQQFTTPAARASLVACQKKALSQGGLTYNQDKTCVQIARTIEHATARTQALYQVWARMLSQNK